MRRFLVFIISILPYLATLGFDFTFDDQNRVLEAAGSLSYNSFFSIFTSPSWPGNLYRPLTDLTFFLTNFIFGPYPFYFHLTNIILHGFAAVCVYRFLSYIVNDGTALFAAILFGLHPVNSEVVSNISYRGEMLALIFGLLACTEYIKEFSFKSSFNCLSFLFVAVLCKESALTFILIAPITELVFKRKFEIKKLAALAPVFPAYLLIRYFVLGSLSDLNHTTGYVDNFLMYEDGITRFVTALLINTKYIVYFFLPYDLAADYSYAQIPELIKWTDAEFGTALFVIIFCLIYLLKFIYNFTKNIKTDIEAYYGLCFFILAFLITANIFIPIGTIFAFRLMYAPSVGLCLAVSTFLNTQRMRLMLSSLPLVLGGLTFYQSSFWKDNETLWQRQQEVAPQSVRVWHTTAVRVLKEGALEASAGAEKKALSILPVFQPGLMLLQRVYYMQGKYEDAKKVLEQLGRIEKSPNYYDGLGWIALKENKLDLAEEYFNKTLSMASGNITAPIGLYAVAVIRNDARRAIEISERFNETQRRDVRFKEYESILLNSLK
jgi:hypothetical protein